MSRFINNGTDGIKFEDRGAFMRGYVKHCYTIKLGKCYCAILDLIDGDDGGGPEIGALPQVSYWITRINVPKAFRGKGYGNQLLDRVLADADAEQTVLYLGPAATSGGLTQRQLVAWYKRKGFTYCDPKAKDVMVRYPKELK